MEEHVQKEGKGFEVLKIKAYEREECRRRIVVSVKVAVAEHPVPQYIRLYIKFKDGSEKFAMARLISAYNRYAYYFLAAAYAREVAPLVNQIQEVKVYEEETR
jgi:hypothetical protein